MIIVYIKIFNFYSIILQLIFPAWFILNAFPTLYNYYYPKIESAINHNREITDEQKRYDDKIKLIFFLSFLVLLFYIFSNSNFQHFRTIIVVISMLLQFYAIIRVSKIVFRSILGLNIRYNYFSAQHNSMKRLSYFFFLIILTVHPSNIILLVNDTVLDIQELNDLIRTLVFLSINMIYPFFILTISSLLVQDTLLYLSLKKWHKSSLKIEIKKDFLKSENLEKLKKSMWEKYYPEKNRASKIGLFIIFFSTTIIQFFIKIIDISMYYPNEFLNFLLKIIILNSKMFLELSSEYIIAISARLSVIIAIIFTFMIFKYNPIISEQGLEVVDFTFTIFLLPVIFNEISRFKNKYQK